MHRIVILGRGGAGKSTTARQLGQTLDLPVLELDKYFWSEDLSAMAPHTWTRVQSDLAGQNRWIMDGDLGPDDVLAPRLQRADAIIILDFGLVLCAWRALRRSRERIDFWWWLLCWRRHGRPLLLAAIARDAPDTALHIITSPTQLAAFISDHEALPPS